MIDIKIKEHVNKTACFNIIHEKYKQIEIEFNIKDEDLTEFTNNINYYDSKIKSVLDCLYKNKFKQDKHATRSFKKKIHKGEINIFIFFNVNRRFVNIDFIYDDRYIFRKSLNSESDDLNDKINNLITKASKLFNLLNELNEL